MIHRRFFSAARNAGFSDNVSTRALIIRLPILGSFAHDGISPHRICFMYRFPSSPITTTDCVGAMLYLGPTVCSPPPEGPRVGRRCSHVARSRAVYGAARRARLPVPLLGGDSRGGSPCVAAGLFRLVPLLGGDSRGGFLTALRGARPPRPS